MQKKGYYTHQHHQNQRPPVYFNNQYSRHQPIPQSLHSPMLSPRSLNYKLSLKNANSVITENSTTCHSTQEGFGHAKKSLKNMLVSTRVRNHHSENFISLRYTDIQEKIDNSDQHSKGSFFSNLFCRMRLENSQAQDQEQGCTCNPKCLWIDHWIKLAKNNIAKNVNQKRCHHYQTTQGFFPQQNIQRSQQKSFQKTQISSSSVSHQSLQQIKKDLHRTQPNTQTFKKQKFINRLESLLTKYSAIDTQVGYIQGMNIISSVLIYHNCGDPNINDSLQILRFLMFERRYRDLYLNEFELGYKISNSLVNTLRVKCHDLYRHLFELHGIDLRIFLIGWLIPMLGNIVPLELMHLVMNSYLQKSWQGLMRIILAMLLYLREQILQMDDETYIMQMLSVQGLAHRMYGHSKIPWEQIILSSRNVKVLFE